MINEKIIKCDYLQLSLKANYASLQFAASLHSDYPSLIEKRAHIFTLSSALFHR